MSASCDPVDSSLSVGVPRQENWRRLPFPSPGDLPDPGIESVSPALAVGLFTAEPATWLHKRYTEQFSTHTSNALAMELGKFTRYVGLSLCLQVKNPCFLLVDFLFCFLSTFFPLYDRIWGKMKTGTDHYLIPETRSVIAETSVGLRFFL